MVPATIRILFLIPSFRTGGAEIHLLSLIRGLDKSKFEVTIAAFYHGNELDEYFENVQGVRIVYLEKRGMFDFSVVKRLNRLIRQQRFHIVQCYNVSARLIGILSAKQMRVPYTIATERTAKVLYTTLGSRIYLFFEKYVIRTADLLITNSYAGRRFSITRGVNRDRIHVIYNGVDKSRLVVTRSRSDVLDEHNIPHDAFVVGMVARIQPLKDPFTFLEAARRVIRAHDRVYFILVGDGSVLHDLIAQAVDQGLAGRLIFTGRRSDVADLVNTMHLVVLTSKQVEGCSNSLLEAMSLGKAVIATRVGGNEELITHEQTGLLVEPQNPAALAESICRLYNDSVLRERLAHKGRDLIREKFSQSAMIQAHEKIYFDLISQLPPN